MDLRQLIQLKQQGTSNRDAAHLLKIHRNTVNAYVHLFLSTDKPYSELLGLDNTSLQELFPSPELKDQKRYDQLLSFLKQVDQDRHRRGFTFYRKWTEYRDLYPDGYGYTQFMDHFHRLYSVPAPSMKLEHKAGNNVFIDFAGKKLQIVDRHTGEVKPVEVFLALLPCSQYLYVVERLLQLEFVRRKENVIITGPTGVGKSYIAQAIGIHACNYGIKTMYYNTARLFSQLKLNKLDGTYLRELRKLENIGLLILDDFGLQALDNHMREALLNVIEDRFQKNSIIVTSQIPISKWYEVIGEGTIADAILDRLINSSHRVELSGESLRKKMIREE